MTAVIRVRTSWSVAGGGRNARAATAGGALLIGESWMLAVGYTKLFPATSGLVGAGLIADALA